MLQLITAVAALWSGNACHYEEVKSSVDWFSPI